jgi:hypothetical protein
VPVSSATSSVFLYTLSFRVICNMHVISVVAGSSRVGKIDWHGRNIEWGFKLRWSAVSQVISRIITDNIRAFT